MVCYRWLSASIPVALLVPQSAYAQTLVNVSSQPARSKEISGAHSGAERPSSAAIEDIIVTARRTSESSQKVPVSVIAFGKEQLEQRQVRSPVDLQSAVSGLTVRQTEHQNQLSFSIRGQSLDFGAYSPPAVLTYINEFQYNSLAGFAIYDMASLQVLKGPQGTLFGRNATGGAILYGTENAGDEFTGRGRLRAGNRGQREIELAVTVPVGDVLSIRLAGDISKQHGYVRNLYYNKLIGENDIKSIRSTIMLRPASNLSNSTMVQYDDSRGSNINAKLYSAYKCGDRSAQGTPLNCTASLLYPAGGYIPAPGVVLRTNDPVAGRFDGVQDFLAFQQRAGFYDVFTDIDTDRKSHALIGVNTTIWDVGDSTQIKNIIGFSRQRAYEPIDFDFTPFSIFIGSFLGGPNGGRQVVFNDRQFSEELQINGTLADERVKYVAGVYHSFQANGFNSLLNSATDLFPGGLLPNFRLNFETRDFTNATYAQATYQIGQDLGVDGLSVTAGFRYTDENVTLRYRPDRITEFGVTTQDARAALGAPDQTFNDDQPSWTIGADYQVTPRLLLYATTRRSWRTGGLNGTAGAYVPATGLVTPDPGFKSERTHDVEIGIKNSGTIASAPYRVALALYDQRVSNVQRVIYATGVALTGNVNKSRIRGAEFDGEIRPLSWLEIGGNGAYTDAKFIDPRGTAVGGAFNGTFGPYADTPRFAGTIYAQIKFPAGNAGDASLRTDFYGQTHTFFSNLNDTLTPGVRLPGYQIVNIRGQLTHVGGSELSITAYAKNMLAREYYAGGLALGAQIGVNGAVVGQPRTFGIELGYRF